jgi:DNA-binding response OmpR family regulator
MAQKNNMSSETKKHSILIIEDEISLRTALRDKFTREGFLALEAKDGEVGLALALKEKPDVLLLDIVMPKMDGVTMLKKLRAENEWSKKVPVLLLTNLGADDERIMKQINGDSAACYLVKSNWSMTDLVEKVKETLSLST